MKKQVEITLFGAKGKRTLNITTRGGFFTRHIKAPRDIAPSTPEPVSPKPDADIPPPSLLEVLKYMESSENHKGGLIIDEILFVATTQFEMKFNHTSLLDALRELYRQGYLVHRLNRFNQHTFCLIEKALIGEGGAA